MQDIIDFFSNPAVKLPLIRSAADTDFQKYVESSLGQYSDFVAALSPSPFNTAVQERLDRIEYLALSINEAISEYFGGHPQKAYQRLDPALIGVRQNLRQLTAPYEQIDQLYRFRIAKPDEWHMRKEDLFHIPFDQRKKVVARRYSIPGLPCLYFGGSLYVCWLEMDQPSFDSIFMARFKVAPGQTINIIDMGMRPRYLADIVQKESNRGVTNLIPQNSSFLLNYAICWPLIAACSIRRPPCDRDATFVAEYVLSQLLLQWVTIVDPQNWTTE